MDDIVTRLLNIASLKGDIGGTVIPVACKEAADEVERLRAAIEIYVLTVSDCYCTPDMERDALEVLKEARRG